jgi:hypothetical protein
MIQADILNSIAAGVVGWKQPTAYGAPVVTTANKASSSGLYYHQGNALATPVNIKATIEDNDVTDANLNVILTELSQGGLCEIASKVFDEDDHLDTGLLYKHENKFTETLTNDTDFVGFEFDLCKRNDLALIINQLICEFDAVNNVKILLFNSQVNALIDSETVTTVANTATYKAADWRLTDLKYGGKWYIGYLRSGLTAKAVKRNFDLANLPTFFDNVGIRPIRVTGWNAETMFDPSQIRYESDTWGLNFNISLFNDFTELVKSNVNRFAKALQLQVCVNVLDIISNSVQSNRNERLSKANAMFELNGNKRNPQFPEHTGLIDKLGVEIRRLRNTFNPKGIIRMTL